MTDTPPSPARKVLPAAAAAVTAVVQVLPREPADPVWGAATPCADWDVRALLNHLTAEHLWAPRLLGGETMEQVGDELDGDVLGPDPVGAWERAVTASVLAWADVEDESREIEMSSGPTGVDEYAHQMLVDLVVHGWDLARAVGAPYEPAAEAVQVVLDYERPRLTGGSGMDGLFEPAVDLTGHPAGGQDGAPAEELADPLAEAVALTGRDPRWSA